MFTNTMVSACPSTLVAVVSNQEKSIYQVSFYLQTLQYSRSDSSNAGLSPLYVGLGCGFLIGGIYVRTSGKTRAMVTFSAAVTSCSYALLASHRVVNRRNRCRFSMERGASGLYGRISSCVF
ncbi:hypothetical protein EDB81DRAFT_753684 [Dactylonectria macrodidyma]|uniref:Uncharacterized protein n=1 Tax=Dactylonectria macrodidyma TaxID=307937 RepID=A0A9P9JHY8_9HYPO|nr:hypothetical protein EDB81DRAFT_753684 [Dactylonectria macrodidyma]